MILDAIVLENFGTYGGIQQAVLTPENPEKPVVLFGGMNGAGKTTFLDAIQLVFYGPKARCSNRGRLAYKEYLRTAIHRAADPGAGASVAVHFRRVIDGETHTYRLLRSWRLGVRGIEESVEVLCDGELDPQLSDNWAEYIESYIPNGIAHLFFFDAEQIKDLAEGEQAAELLGTAIHSLLGLDLVDRLEGDLLTLERRKKIAAKSEDEARVLKEAEDEHMRLEKILEEATNEKAQLNSELGMLSKDLERCTKLFEAEGGALFVQRKEIEAKLAQYERELAADEHTLHEFAAGASPLLLIAPLLDEAESQIRRESDIRKAQVLVEALEERDAKMLEFFRAALMSNLHLKRLDSVFREDREKRLLLSNELCYLQADEHLVSELRHLRTTVLPEVAGKITRQLSKTAEARERVLRMETTLARVPAADAIARLQRELETLQIRRKQKQAELEAVEAKMQVIVRQRSAAEERVRKALETTSEQQFGLEDRDRVLRHSAKVRGTLEVFRAAVIRKHAQRIEALMLEAFAQLLRKTSLVTALKIDPNTFQIELNGADGRPLAIDRLSAGERQLLATSLLWGLARASGRPLPMIIDTPLGRLDSSHRRHLIERYFPVASHQVILLSTDEEIDEESLGRLLPYIGQTYHLQFNDVSRSTTITKGYFWNHEAPR